MRYPQIVIYEENRTIRELLHEFAEEHRYLLRESRQPEACLRLLMQDRISVLILKLTDLEDELTLLANIQEQVPDCAVILVSEGKWDGAEQRGILVRLAYDLGVRYVLFPPLEKVLLEEMVSGLIDAELERTGGLDELQSA